MASQFAQRAAKAQANISSPYLDAGKYVLEVVKVQVTNGFGGEFFIVEFNVLQSEDTGQIGMKTGKPITACKPGTKPALRIKLDPKGYGYGNVLAFLSALADVPPDQLDADTIDAVCGTHDKAPGANPFAGWKIEDLAFEKPQKSDPSKPFTNHRWAHVTPADDQRAALVSLLEKIAEK